jgi:hypothetical protein
MRGSIMKDKIKALMKKNALFHFTTDGLIEMAVGIILLDGGFGYLHFQLTENYYSDPTIYISITPITLFSLLALLVIKRTVVYNRIGYMSLKTDAIKIATWIMGGIALLLILFLLPGLAGKYAGTDMAELIRNIEIHLVWICSSVLFAYTARKYRLKRFYLYSAMLILAPAVYLYTHYRFTIASTLLASGALLFLTGLLCFIRFLKAYPLTKED